MGTPAPWVTSQGAAAPAAAAPASSSLNAGTVLLLGIVASGIAMWVAGKHREKEQEERAKLSERDVENTAYDLEGAREDAQSHLAIAFASRPAVPWGYP